MGLFENGFWLDVVLKNRNLRLNDCALVAIGFASLIKILVHTKESVTHGLDLLKLGSNIRGQPFFLREFYQQMTGFGLMLASTLVLLYMGEQPLANAVVRDGHLNPTFLVLVLQSMMLIHLNLCIYVAHAGKSSFNPFRNRLFLFFNIFVLGIYVMDKIVNGKLNILDFIKVLFVIQFLAQTHFVVNVFQELKSAMRIPIFSAYDPKE